VPGELLLEDLAYGAESGRTDYLTAARASLDRLFPRDDE